MDLSAALPMLLRQLPPELRAAFALLADIAADADKIGPDPLAPELRERYGAAGTSAGVPPLLLVALALQTGGPDSDYWRRHLSAAAASLAGYVNRHGSAAGLRAYMDASGYTPEQSRELSGRVMGAFLILSARELDPGGLERFAEVMRNG